MGSHIFWRGFYFGRRGLLAALFVCLAGTTSGAVASSAETWRALWTPTVKASPRVQASVMQSAPLTAGVGTSPGGAALSTFSELLARDVSSPAIRQGYATGIRQIAKAPLVQLAAKYTKLFGPHVVGILAMSLIWDEILEAWTKTYQPTSLECKMCGSTSSPTIEDWCYRDVWQGGTQYKRMYGYTGLFSSNSSSCPSMPQPPSGGVSLGGCSGLPSECGYNPVKYFYPVETGKPVPATDLQVQEAISEGIGTDGAKAADIASRLIELGAHEELGQEASPLQVTGPETLGAPSVSTQTSIDAQGQPTVQTTTSTMQVTYAGDTAYLSTRTDTQTCVGEGSCSTTTQIEAGEAPASWPEEQRAFCEQNPGALACATAAVPTPEPLLEKKVELKLESELSDAGSCPRPVAISILGSSHTLSWQPVCDFASGMRPVVLIVAWLSAVLFLFFRLRGMT